MADVLLNECNQCGALSTSEACPNNPAHRTRQLSIAESKARAKGWRARPEDYEDDYRYDERA